MQPVFYYDLGSPYSYLTAERLQRVLPVVPVWQPILLGGIWQQTGGQSWGFTDERDAGIAEVERRAQEYELMPVRWPEGWPNNTLKAMRAAVFAQSIGRAVAFSLAAFRQAFAGGRDLSTSTTSSSPRPRASSTPTPCSRRSRRSRSRTSSAR